MKLCKICNRWLDRETCFYTHNTTKDGYMPVCKECHCIKTRNRHRERVKLGTDPQQLLRQKALEILGGKCVQCGFSDVRALQIDHINGGGSAERTRPGYNRRDVERKIVSGETSEYQLLCSNCNWIKRAENKEYFSRVHRP